MVLRPLFIATFVLVVTGCVPIPVGDGAREGVGARFGGDDLKKVETEATTRADVLRLLGEPDARTDDNRTFFYGWSHSNYIVPWAIPLYPTVVLMSGSAGYALLTVEFDEHDAIVRRNLEPDSDAYIYYPMGGRVEDLNLIPASPSSDAECAIYVYGSGPLALASVTLDDRLVVPALAGMSTAYYFLVEPRPGKHRLTATNPGPDSAEPVASIDVDCTGGSNTFVNVRRRWGFGDTSSVIEVIDNRDGQEAVRGHKRLLTKYGVRGY
jgi:hypothetical protein